MSHFTAALDSLMNAHRWNQSELARKTDIHQAVISRWLSDERRPDKGQLSQLAGVFRLTEAIRLVAAYVRDAVPDAFLNNVIVSELHDTPDDRVAELDVGGMCAQAAVYAALQIHIPESYPLPLQKLLRSAAAVGEKRPEVVRALQSLLDVLS